MRVHLRYLIIAVLSITFIGSAILHAQHRGDDLAFQGMDFSNGLGVRASAMGGAYSAVSGDLDALYWNPAGLIGIEGFQLSVNGFQYNKLWRERQDYRPNRQLVTMSFILDGLYTPNPDYNGWYDFEAFLDDPEYIVDDPELGVDPYSKEGADWENEIDDFQLYHVTAAMPFRLMNRSFVASVGYSGHIPVLNYDRNDTHLVPHIGFDGYGDLPPRVTSAEDSVRMHWSRYERERFGPVTQITGGIAAGITDQIRLGFSVTRSSGELEERLNLNRVGYFDMVQGYQIFRFGYDTLDVGNSGVSTFSSLRMDIGALFQFKYFGVGFRVSLPYTIKREWQNIVVTADPNGTETNDNTGVDEVKIPLSFNAGISLTPVSKFRISLDISHRPFKDAEFAFTDENIINRGWMNQTTYAAGMEYSPIERISIMAGYRNVPQVFIPDGNAIDDRGPEAETYSVGMSVRALWGRFDVAYLYQTLKYYDVYYSNTNWAYEQFSTWMFGYTLML